MCREKDRITFSEHSVHTYAFINLLIFIFSTANFLSNGISNSIILVKVGTKQEEIQDQQNTLETPSDEKSRKNARKEEKRAKVREWAHVFSNFPFF